MPYDIQLPDGTLVDNIPDDIDPVAAKAKIFQAYPELALGEKKTLGQVGKDVLAGVGSGLGSLAQFPGQVYGLVTGDMDQGGLQQLGRNLQQYSEEAKSPIQKAKESLRSQKIAQTEGLFNQAGVAILETLKDPALLSSFIFEQAPQLLGTMGGGYLTKQGIKALMLDATQEVLAKSGVRGAIGTGALMQGADIGTDTYERIFNERMIQGYPEQLAREEALTGGRKAAVEAAALTGLTSFGAGSTIERALTRGAAAGPKRGIIRGTLGETLSEAVEEGGGRLASNIEFQKVKPESDVLEGVGAAIGMGALGGGLFGLPSSILNSADANQIARAKAQMEEAKRKAQEENKPQEVLLQIGYDPNVQGKVINTPIIVNPDGTTTFPSERNQFAQVVPDELSEAGMSEKYGIRTEEQIKQQTFSPETIKGFGISPKASLYKNKDILNADLADPAQADKVKGALEDYLKKYPNANPEIRKKVISYLLRQEFHRLPESQAPTQITEASITPEADQAVIQQRLAEGFRNRPEIKKIYDDYNKKMQEGDADKAALSAFNSIVTPQTIKSFGIPANSAIYGDQELINADLSNPETADRIRAKLMEIQKQTKSAKIKENIDKYLNRSEFITPTYVEQFLNPVREEGQENLDHFVFINNEGEIESKYGTIVEKGGKKYAKYSDNKFQKGGDRELNENVLVNPKSPDQIELMSLYKAKDKLMKQPDDFKSWLIGKGVDPKERSDIAIESRLPHKMFRSGGFKLDDLVRMAIEEGILHEPDFQEGIGGVESMSNYIKMAVDGDFVPTSNNMRNMNDLENLQRSIEALESRLQGVSEEVIAEEFRGEETPTPTPTPPAKKPLTAKDVIAGMDAKVAEGKNQSKEGLTPDQLEVLNLADKIEESGEAGFANSMRQNVRRKNPLTPQNMDFYRNQAEQFISRTGKVKSPIKEDFDINTFVEGFDRDKARLASQTDFFGTKTSTTVQKSNYYIKKLAEKINQAGYKVIEINSTTPKYLQELKTKISQIAGSTTRLMKEQEALDKDYKRADVEKHQKTLDLLEQDFAEADALLEQNPEAKREMPNTPYADKFIKDSKKLTKDIRAALDKMGLKDVGLKFEDAMRRRINGEMTAINGEYFDKMIELSLSGDNIFRTMNHEALHAMKDLGFFADKEWKTLENKARSEWMEKYKIVENYSKESEETQLEEAIAYAFADAQTQPAPIKSLMSRTVNFLKRIGNWMRGNGYKTAEDIFGKAAAGELRATKEATKNAMAELDPKESAIQQGIKKFTEAFERHGIDPYKSWLDSPLRIYNALNKIQDNIEESLVKAGFSSELRQGSSEVRDIFQKKIEPAARQAIREKQKTANNKAPKQERMKASFEGVDEAYADAIRKQFTQEEATVGQKFNNLKSNFFEKMVTGVFDEFRAIKKYTTEGYMMARLSKSIDGGLQGLLEHGQVYIKDGL